MLTAEPLSRQMRRKSRTRTALVAAAEALFAARGPDAVSIDEIVAAADVAKGSFYNHFTDKDALAREITRCVRQDVERDVEALNANIADPAIRMAQALCLFTRFAQRHPERARAMTQLYPGATDPDAPLNEGVRRDVSAGLASGRFADTVRDTAIVFVIGTVQASIHRAIGANENTAKKMAVGICALLLRGLGLRAAEAQIISADAATTVFNTSARNP